MKYKLKIILILTTIIMFFSLPLKNVSASTGQIDIINNSHGVFELPVYISHKNQFRLNEIPKSVGDYAVKKIMFKGYNTVGTSTGQQFLNESYIEGSNILPTTFETFKTGRYKIELYKYSYSTNPLATLEFKVWNVGNTGTTPEPTDPPTTKDYTSLLLAINENIQQVARDFDYLSNDEFTSVKNAVLDIGNQISNAITTQTTEIKTSLNTINNSINTMKNDINNRLDATNSHLNDIKKELQTDKPIKKNTVPDISDVLEKNKANTPQNKYQDDNNYFEQPNVVSNESNMPDMPDIKKWDDVDVPVELSKDIENKIDKELTQDSFTEDTELTQDSFTKENELLQDSFTKDSELSQDTFTKDNELSQDSFTQDNELSQDNFNNTHEYEQTNKFEKQPEFEQTEQDYNLRWKSINGIFQ